MYVKAGKYGGTDAHRDIAFEFGSAISPVFKMYLIAEFQRLKTEEQQRLSLEWDLQRTLAKINYRIHTDAIKEQIIPPKITKEQANFIYASEADMLNVALFGKTAARRWAAIRERAGIAWIIRSNSYRANKRNFMGVHVRLVSPFLKALRPLDCFQGSRVIWGAAAGFSTGKSNATKSSRAQTQCRLDAGSRDTA
jgi:hypothetical protein